MKVTARTDQVMQLSTTDEHGAPMLSIVAKRTYVIEGGRCVVAAEQLPLVPMRLGPEDPEILLDDSDVWPLKQLTDVVVHGHAYAHGGGRQIVASIAVGELIKEFAVIGDRRPALADGRIVFSEPERFEKMPLDAAHAYGGHDHVAERKYGNPLDAVRPHVSPNRPAPRYSPYRYPRNGVGKGFVIDATAEALDATLLPNLEDPSDLLMPERLEVKSARSWPSMPLPWTTAWQSFGAFPRYAYLGGVSPFDAPAGEIAELRRGFMPKGFSVAKPGAPSARVFNGGSHGLQLGPVVAGATSGLAFKLRNMHPTRRELSFTLPAEAPTIKVDGREGKLLSTDAVVHHVVIEPDLDRVSVVWRGAARARRPYLPDEIVTMPLEVTWP